MKGTLTQVNIGHLTIDGILGEDGNLYVASRTVSSIFSTRQDNTSRDLKAILGEGSSTRQITLSNEKHENLPIRLTCITQLEFEKVLRYYDRKGNTVAQELSDLLVGLSLTQMFNDAFGIKFEKDERSAWLALRAKSKFTRRTLTDAAQDWYRGHYGVNPAGPYYAELTDKMYLMLFNKRAEALKVEFEVPKGKLLRDYLPKKMLNRVEAAEEMLVMKIDRGRDPIDAIQDLA
jgi:hypothetical protein